MILRPRFVEELFVSNAFCLATLLADSPDEIKSIQDSLPQWILFLNIARYERYPEEAVAWKEEQVRDLANREGIEVKKTVGEVSASHLLKILATTAEKDRRIRYKDSGAILPFETTVDKAPEIMALTERVASGFGYPPPDISFYIQPVIQGCQCQCEVIFPYCEEDKGEREKVKNLFSIAAENLRGLGAYYSRPYGTLAEITYKDPGITKLCRIVKEILDPNDIMHSGKLF